MTLLQNGMLSFICYRLDEIKVSNIAVVLRWYKQQYENEGKKQCCESENNSYACKK